RPAHVDQVEQPGSHLDMVHLRAVPARYQEKRRLCRLRQVAVQVTPIDHTDNGLCLLRLPHQPGCLRTHPVERERQVLRPGGVPFWQCHRHARGPGQQFPSVLRGDGVILEVLYQNNGVAAPSCRGQLYRVQNHVPALGVHLRKKRHAYLPWGCRPNLPCTALAVRPPALKSAIQTSITSTPSCPVDCSTCVPGGALWTLTTTLALLPALLDGCEGNGITL